LAGEDRLQNDLYCVGWGVKLYSVQSKTTDASDLMLQQLGSLAQ